MTIEERKRFKELYYISHNKKGSVQREDDRQRKIKDDITKQHREVCLDLEYGNNGDVL